MILVVQQYSKPRIPIHRLHGNVIYLAIGNQTQGVAMTAAKLRIDLSMGLIEVEGSEAFILELYGDFKDRISKPALGVTQPPQPFLPPPKAADSESVGIPHVSATKTSVAQKLVAAAASRKPKRSKKEEPKLLTDLDLNQGTLGRLKDFHAKYALKTNMEHNLVFAYFLKDGMGLEEIGEDHLFTCYRTVGIKIPRALRQSVLDTAQTKGWIDTDATGVIRLTTVGRNHIEHDLAKVTDAE